MFDLKPLGTRELRKGEMLVREGDPPGNVYYLAGGELLVIKSTSIIGKIRAAKFAGEMSILLNRPRIASLMAYTKSRVDVYDGPMLLTKLTTNRPMGAVFLQTLLERLEMTRERVSEYQHRILKEYVKTLVAVLVERRTAAEWLKEDEARRVLREYELIFDGRLSHKDAVEDYKILMWEAEQKGVAEEYKKKLAQKFRSFVPLDLGPFRIQRPDSFGQFREAGMKIAETISTLTRYLADFQRIDIGCAEWELGIFEDSIPFAEREPLLKEVVLASSVASKNLRDLERRRQAYDVEIRDQAKKADRDTLPLLPLARKFEVEEAFTKGLEKLWNERLRRLTGAAKGGILK